VLKRIALLQNGIQKYAWGSKTAIPELLGETPDGSPQAELWMGAHPGAPSMAYLNGRWVPLTNLIETDPESLLGKRAAKKYNNQLPFLFKVLAAAMPLSIQAHPDTKQAREGFSRETAAGISLEAGNRNYRDANHKPECICALTPFWAMNGFRNIPEILHNVETFCPKHLDGDIAELRDTPHPHALKRFFHGLLTKPKDAAGLITEEAVSRAKLQADGADPVAAWIVRLHETYPRDIGILSPALLNLVLLKPGEAMYLSSGRLHAYLEGVGMELMANSDNVLRGGLTPKHVAVPELLDVLRFEETVPEILNPVQEAPGIRRYITPAEEFALSEITVDGSFSFEDRQDAGVEILFCLRGGAAASDGSADGKLHLAKGMSMIVPAAVKTYTLEGSAVFYRASVGGN